MKLGVSTTVLAAVLVASSSSVNAEWSSFFKGKDAENKVVQVCVVLLLLLKCLLARLLVANAKGANERAKYETLEKGTSSYWVAHTKHPCTTTGSTFDWVVLPAWTTYSVVSTVETHWDGFFYSHFPLFSPSLSLRFL